jgi:hypothetical protein
LTKWLVFRTIQGSGLEERKQEKSALKTRLIEDEGQEKRICILFMRRCVQMTGFELSTCSVENFRLAPSRIEEIRNEEFSEITKIGTCVL